MYSTLYCEGILRGIPLFLLMLYTSDFGEGWIGRGEYSKSINFPRGVNPFSGNCRIFGQNSG